MTCIVWTGVTLYFALYIFQGLAMTSYMANHIDERFWVFAALYLPALIFLCCFGCLLPAMMHEKAIRYVWLAWFLYILVFVIAVAIIFVKVVPDLDGTETFGPNVLKTLLCITPVLLILLLNITISPSNRRFVERVSVTAALDLFDSIEMLAIIVEQKKNDFTLDQSIEIAIIIFVCISFLLSPFALFQHRIKFGEVTVRKKTMLARTIFQVLLVNLTFLVMRFIVWFHYDYNASIFIAKNIIAIAISFVEVCVVFGFFNCGTGANETFNV